MHCPQCRVEYRDGFSICSDCGSALAAGLPPELVEEPHDLELVTVFEAQDSFGVTLAKAALDEAGIPYEVDDEDGGFPIGAFGSGGVGVRPHWKRHTRIRLPKEFEAQAGELLEPLLNPEP
jgi:hypothetical protein